MKLSEETSENKTADVEHWDLSYVMCWQKTPSPKESET